MELSNHPDIKKQLSLATENSQNLTLSLGKEKPKEFKKRGSLEDKFVISRN